jgi:polysaccharide export outer membrane protein
MDMARGIGGAQYINDYRIGPEDLLDISVFEVPELSRTVRVSTSGEISLPLVGTLKAAGLSPVGMEQALTARLKQTYVKDPQVSVFVKEFKSDPVSVVGAVKMPGLYQIQTRKSLIEVLALAQGFAEGPTRQAGRTVIVTRKNAVSGTETFRMSATTSQAATAEAGILEIPIKDLVQTGDPKWNVPIFPGDVVKVVPAGTVYVAGNVTRPGGFPLTEFDNITAIQALAMAGGTVKAASKKNAMIIRRDAAGKRVEQRVDLGRIQNGKDPDPELGPNDILFVPGSVGKESALRAIETAIQTGTGILIWRR